MQNNNKNQNNAYSNIIESESKCLKINKNKAKQKIKQFSTNYSNLRWLAGKTKIKNFKRLKDNYDSIGNDWNKLETNLVINKNVRLSSAKDRYSEFSKNLNTNELNERYLWCSNSDKSLKYISIGNVNKSGDFLKKREIHTARPSVKRNKNSVKLKYKIIKSDVF